MRRHAVLAVAALAILAAGRPRAVTPLMPVSEIRPGMVGVGRTVFNGTKVDEFQARILGVIENVMAPQRTLILARLEGGPLATAGVIAGMSGSPVYIDGRLIGAVSYALGAFAKEPIAGITPIAEMTEDTALGATVGRPAAARFRPEAPITGESLMREFRRVLSWNRPFADRAGDVQLVGAGGIPGLGGREVGTWLHPIATPLVMSGFESDIAAMLGDAFRGQGFVPTGGGAAGTRPGEMPFDGPLKPGDAVGVNFVNGDVLLGGTGTVTHIDGDRVYAFGHPMYNLGAIEFPMTRAYVYTVLPSLFSSSKLSTTGEVIGTVLQDRPSAIAGRLGTGPSMMPVTLSLQTDRGAARTFRFHVVRDQVFTPLMTYSALVNTLLSYERQFGISTYTIQGTARVANHEAVAIDNLFSGDNAALAASAHVITPITALMTNDHEKVTIDALELTVKTAEEPRIATLVRAWIDDPRPRAGRTVPVKVLLRTYRGEDLLQTVPIQIPAHVAGTLAVVVSDGSRLAAAEQREARLPQPKDVPQLIRTLNRARRNNAVYVKLVGPDPGAVVHGEVLPSLPPSVLAVLEADRSGGNFSPLSNATIGEWEFVTAHTVSGVRTLTLSVSPN